MAVVGYRTKETTTTTGTGTYSLNGTSFGFQTFVAAVGHGAQVYYVCEDVNLVAETGNWEVGLGTVTDGAPDTLTRDQILASSNGGAAVNWPAGTRNIFSAHPASGFMVGANNLSELTNAGTARTNLGLGSIATRAETDFLEKTGGTMTGKITLDGNPTSANHAANKTYVDTGDTAKVAKAGDTMTGALTLSGDPTTALHAATKQYVDAAAGVGITVEESDGIPSVAGVSAIEFNQATNLIVVNEGGGRARIEITQGAGSSLDADKLDGSHASAFALSGHNHDATYLKLAGGTMTGALTLNGSPSLNLHAATKQYVDTASFEDEWASGCRVAFYSATKPSHFTWLTLGERFSLVADSGQGATGGDWNWGSGVTVSGTSLTTAQMPSHSHNVTVTHARSKTSTEVLAVDKSDVSGVGTNTVFTTTTTGSGSSHNHGTGSVTTWRPTWIKCRVASRN